MGYDPEDRRQGGNGYVPVTLQYRPYQALAAREHSLAGGDSLEESRDRSYRGKWNTAANEADLDIVIDTKKRMGDKPVVTVVTLKKPMVMAELEPHTDALLVEYGVTPQAVVDVLTGAFTPGGCCRCRFRRTWTPWSVSARTWPLTCAATGTLRDTAMISVSD